MADVTGAAELQRTLDRLQKQYGPKIGKKAVAAGGRKLAAGIRSQVPQPRVRKAVKSRVVKSRVGGVDQAKAGFNVGRRTRKQTG